MSVFDLVQPVTKHTILESSLYFGLFFLFQFLGAKFLPSIKGYGFPTPQKTRKDYELTGLQMFFITQITYLVVRALFGFSLEILIRNFWSFFTVVNIFSIGFSIFLYAKGKLNKSPKFENTSFLPDFLFEFWCGVELNPTLFGVDLKMFFYQPSLLGMHLFVISFAEYQHTRYGLSTQMILLQIFIWLYLFTHYIKEEFMLSTWDIIEEHFGFMLVWGDMIYVPFWYSVVGWFVADSTEDYGMPYYIFVVALHLFGHFIFRVSNWQKYVYKRYGKNSTFLGQKCVLLEDRLLISGFWGIGRHLNYSGEIITYLTFALASRLASFVPYILPFSLLILLSQRAWRDDQRCSSKYKELWQKYCKIATFKMIPGVY
ncbi:hypothetical protein ABPG74_003257 [Tetrahymena malaccensis]